MTRDLTRKVTLQDGKVVDFEPITLEGVAEDEFKWLQTQVKSIPNLGGIRYHPQRRIVAPTCVSKEPITDPAKVINLDMYSRITNAMAILHQRLKEHREGWADYQPYN